MRTHWKKFEHGADTEVRVWSAAKAEALEQAALVMMDAITSPDEVQARDRVDIACEAPDDGRARCCVPNQNVFRTRLGGVAAFKTQLQVDTNAHMTLTWDLALNDGEAAQ